MHISVDFDYYDTVIPSAPLPVLLPSLLFPFLLTRGSGQRYKLPHRGSGGAPAKNAFVCISTLKNHQAAVSWPLAAADVLNLAD